MVVTRVENCIIWVFAWRPRLSWSFQTTKPMSNLGQRLCRSTIKLMSFISSSLVGLPPSISIIHSHPPESSFQLVHFHVKIIRWLSERVISSIDHFPFSKRNISFSTHDHVVLLSKGEEFQLGCPHQTTSCFTPFFSLAFHSIPISLPASISPSTKVRFVPVHNLRLPLSPFYYYS